MAAPTLVWFRSDLRLTDNPALNEAARSGRPVIPVYILDTTVGDMDTGAASKWWLHHSLKALDEDLQTRRSRLTFRRGDALTCLQALIEETGADRVVWNRCYEPWRIARDTAIKSALTKTGIDVQSYPGSVVHEPWTVKKQNGKPFVVFTPFWKAWRTLPGPNQVAPPPDNLTPPNTWPQSEDLKAWRLQPRNPDWAAGFHDCWLPGEAGALSRLRHFLSGTVEGYKTDRDFPAIAGTSRLSAPLHFGEISPRMIYQLTTDGSQGAEAFLREACWRDFNIHLLYHTPGLVTENFNTRFDAFPWRDDEHAFDAWTKGQTGYPLVDAGMRELWQTGYMHNRVRMLCGSFLVKHLLQDWRKGEAWFRDTLVDADLANNVCNWQWVAGCGADAAPYFRIFNPTLQAQKFDPNGDYIRTYVPELAKLPKKHMAEPWNAPPAVLESADVRLGETYPRPIVDHKTARERALSAFRSLPKIEG